MNDTEAEARRLLAAATEDMPPGIDLLSGFDAARRRDRARRTRGRAVLSAGVAMAAAAVTAVTLTIGSAPPALATVSTVTTALSRSTTQSYHLTEQISMYYIYNGRIKYPSHGTCTIVADPVRHLEAHSGSGCPTGRKVGAYTYFYIPATPHPGRHWWRTPTASIGHSSLPSSDGGITGATPQQMLSAIKKADKVTVAGPASGPGWTGTRYAFSSSHPFGGPGMGDKISGTVDVDGQGRARVLTLTIRSTSPVNVFVTTYTLAFSDFGARVTVTPPPATQTFSGP